METLSENDRSEFIAALGEAESGDTAPLDRWLTQHGHPKEVIVAENVLDSFKGKQLANLGSPLYMAVVCDLPKAVRYLLEAGGDCNYIHPSHGDTPLLHACEQGYTECVDVMLTAAELDVAQHVTVDRKLFLGQGVPQWEEGGRSALIVASAGGHVDIVKRLLQHHNDEAVEWLLNHSDTFHRSPLEVTLDGIALASDKGEQRARLIENACCLLQKKNESSNPMQYIQTHIPARDVAYERERERTLAVRARVLQADIAKKQLKKEVGLAAIAAHYSPQHAIVYDPEKTRAHLTVDINEVKEPFAGVFTFPFASAQICKLFWDEVHHYEATACSDPSLGLPLPVRHDGNFGDLQNVGFQHFLDEVSSALLPLLRRHLPQVVGDEGIDAYHAFVTRNYVGRDENATFKMHCDKSELTINICLHASPDFEGSTVGFYTPKEPEAVPEDDDRQFTLVHSVGYAAVHTGTTWHRTDPITRGTRGSLIVWARRKNHAAHAQQ